MRPDNIRYLRRRCSPVCRRFRERSYGIIRGRLRNGVSFAFCGERHGELRQDRSTRASQARDGQPARRSRDRAGHVGCVDGALQMQRSLCERLMAFWVAQGSRRLHPTQVRWRRLLSGASNPWLTEKEDFGFKPPSRLEQIGDKQASQAPQSETNRRFALIRSVTLVTCAGLGARTNQREARDRARKTAPATSRGRSDNGWPWRSQSNLTR